MAGGPGYAGKPRVVVVIQDDRFDATQSITVCPFTGHAQQAPLFRLPVEPSDLNGLQVPSELMVDKIVTVPKSKLGRHVGQLADSELVALNRALATFLGLAS